MHALRRLAAATAIFLAACSSTGGAPVLHVRIDINGQVVDRQFRELVVRATNTGGTALHHVQLDVSLPDALPVIGSGSAQSMVLEATKRNGGERVYTYSISQLQPGSAAVARLPFRTQSMPSLDHGQIMVVARHGSARVEAKRNL